MIYVRDCGGLHTGDDDGVHLSPGEVVGAHSAPLAAVAAAPGGDHVDDRPSHAKAHVLCILFLNPVLKASEVSRLVL